MRFGSETGAVGPADWTSGEWVELYNSGTVTVDLSSWTIEDHSSRALTMSTNNVVHPTSATNLRLSARRLHSISKKRRWRVMWLLYEKHKWNG